ncbi:sensor histidine kinase [bacterium D16-51]|nr:sensor histidine kinase [bacterium D16-59]RKI59529.1 sensor histidine kinase [bacterium D16-51]
MFYNRTVRRLDKMLDDAINGEFEESDFTETELSRLEAKWKHFLSASQLSKEQLDQERQNIEGLVADISHQTRTPIANLKLYSALLEERLQKKGDALGEEQELLQEIIAQTEKLEFLVQSLTKMSRLESNMITVNPQKGKVAPFVIETVSQMQATAREKRRCLEVGEANGDCMALFDVKWTKEALGNILDNAVKYSYEDSTIQVSIREYELYAAVSVKNEGIGISEQESSKIFGRFYRSEKVLQKEGVGLGLYLAREILQRENGYIEVRSKEGNGAEFILYLWKG